ncbi:cytochrome P450 [Asanoa siamensis]|uniref:Cytochrome P450 n=1 Tax=Asanoa siamensis TaxID=926357 RepID=A0ABQ4D2J7_9ACTN|nr:cytochrome P450 [Asanoa siamensis]GIF77725.1 cytochrome P450 [Asanoa siamensis]
MSPNQVLTYHDLPGPTGLPLLGHRLALARAAAPAVAMQHWCDRHGPTYRLWLSGPAVVTADPSLVDAILRQRPDTFRRSPRMAGILREMGVDGLFTAEGATWQRLRRVATRSLDAKHLDSYFEVLTRTAERLRRRWRAAAVAGERIDVLAEMTHYTLDVTVGLATGHDLNSVENRGEGLASRLPALFPEIGRRLYAPFPYWRFFGGTRRRRIDATLREIDILVQRHFAAARQRVAGGAAPTNFLEALVAPVEGEPPLTHKELLGNVLTMLVAGEDTTSATAAWAIHFLAGDPAAVRRIRSEADSALGDRAIAENPATLRQLVEADAAVKEAMRLRPVAPILALQARHDVVLPGNQGLLELKAGTVVFVLQTRGAHHDHGRFPQPQEFDSARWLRAGPSPESAVAPFLPFGAGPRFCPGRNLALMEAILVVSMLCREFDLEQDTLAGPVGERQSFSMFPTNIFVRAKPSTQEAER